MPVPVSGAFASGAVLVAEAVPEATMTHLAEEPELEAAGIGDFCHDEVLNLFWNNVYAATSDRPLPAKAKGSYR